MTQKKRRYIPVTPPAGIVAPLNLKNLKITSSSLRDGHLCRDGQVQRGQLAWLSGSLFLNPFVSVKG